MRAPGRPSSRFNLGTPTSCPLPTFRSRGCRDGLRSWSAQSELTLRRICAWPLVLIWRFNKLGSRENLLPHNLCTCAKLVRNRLGRLSRLNKLVVYFTLNVSYAIYVIIHDSHDELYYLQLERRIQKTNYSMLTKYLRLNHCLWTGYDVTLVRDTSVVETSKRIYRY